MSVTEEEHIYKVGDRALLPYTNADLEVEIVETRRIGLDGPRMVRIRLEDPYGEAEAEEWDVPATRVRPVSGAA